MATSAYDDEQVRTFQLQVFRSGQWVDIPVRTAKGSHQKSMAGQLEVQIDDRQDDQYRSRLYEGEKVRAYRGVLGSGTVRCWTGYVDAPTASDQQGISRDVVITDYIKELNDAILIQGVVYDTWQMNAACADVIQQAINTGQFVPTDDNGNPLTTTTGYNQPNGNPICYFPDLFNANGTEFQLASGTLGSFTNNTITTIASFTVPVASGGASYTAFELPNQYVIASTMVWYDFTLASNTTNLPPPRGQVVVDYYNGICYFNAADGNTAASFSGSYYSAPNWAFAPGAKVGDVIAEIMDKCGFRFYADGNGKIFSKYIDTTKAPYRALGKHQYQDFQLQTNRDRRNVIVCEGWDGNCGQIITSKAVNYDDINNPPPRGLGKRQYMILQDPTWKEQSACNNAAYFAMQQVGRRGKIAAWDMIDDPLMALEDVVVFEGLMPEVSDGDFFYIESINWNFSPKSGGGFDATANVTATALPGRGTAYLGPATAVTSLGSYDFSQDVQPIQPGAHLNPAGGSVSSTFSIAAGLTLNYVNNELGTEEVNIYGSDGSLLGPYVTTRAVNGTIGYSVALPTASMTAGVWYVVQLKFMDQSGNLGIYRDFAMALP